MKKNKIALPLSSVIYVPGAISTPPGDQFDKFHILAYITEPYQRLCDKVPSYRTLWNGMTAPAARFCPRCLQAYTRRLSRAGQVLTILGPDPAPNYIVAAGAVWTGYSVKSAIVPNGTSVGREREIMQHFVAELKDLARLYGSEIEWLPDFEPIAVLLSDKPDYPFDWNQLLYLAWERTRAWRDTPTPFKIGTVA